jgi:protein SCO1/2
MLTRRTMLIAATCIMLAPAARAEGLADDVSVEPKTFTLKPFMLQDVNGTIVDRETLSGKFVLVFFGYTSCPDVCPTALTTISAALQQLTPAEADRLLPLFVTLDPDRDTGKVLSDYTAAFDSHIVALSGPKVYTDSLADQFGVKYTKVTPDPAKPESYSIDHTAAIFFLDPDGTLIRTLGHASTPDSLTEAIRAAFKVRPAG